ncbi:MAG: hypothetical protein V2I97_20875 [Desulfococcaceae bacterium]|jgi:hypothetical protein|nr:hypothetical protein [Desulfococcaceae bacterium]
MLSEKHDYSDKTIFSENSHCNVDILCGRLAEMNTFRAKIKKYSREGIYYESEEYVEKGTMIFYKIQNLIKWMADPQAGKDMRTAALAEVENCREIEKEGFYRYGTNVRYYKKNIPLQ